MPPLLPPDEQNHEPTLDLFLYALPSTAPGKESWRHGRFFLSWLGKHKVIFDSCPALLGHKNIDLMTRRGLKISDSVPLPSGRLLILF